jgi:hypothetical protein
METLIGGRWLNRIGIIAIISAVTFFLKYAFDNNWIGPSGRVAIGILLGAAMLPWSHWLLQRGYAYFSEGIAGLGAAVLYLSIWAGCQYYKLCSRRPGPQFAAHRSPLTLWRVSHAHPRQRRQGRPGCALHLSTDSRRGIAGDRNAP